MPRKPHLYNYVYKTTCIVTNRYYIGVHSTSSLDDNYLGSGKILRRSISKYGKDSHVKEIIEFLDTREEAEKLEESLICESMTDSNCMNLTGGGTGFKMNHSEETKTKISSSLSDKTYEEIHGEKQALIERTKRQLGVKKYWNEVSEASKENRSNNVRLAMLKYYSENSVIAKELTCNVCGFTGKSSAMYRWHFQNCNKNK